jgi:multicomponent Na+:H+ antiporter subunit F
METVGTICFVLLTVSGALCLGRVLAGPTLADRILALDCLLIIVVVGVGVDAAVTGRGIYLDVLLVVALVAFIGTTAVARFLERRGES